MEKINACDYSLLAFKLNIKERNQITAINGNQLKVIKD